MKNNLIGILVIVLFLLAVALLSKVVGIKDAFLWCSLCFIAIGLGGILVIVVSE